MILLYILKLVAVLVFFALVKSIRDLVNEEDRLDEYKHQCKTKQEYYEKIYGIKSDTDYDSI